jgi:hypothetical protein
VAIPFHSQFPKEQLKHFQQIDLIKVESPFLKPQRPFRLITTKFASQTSHTKMRDTV